MEDIYRNLSSLDHWGRGYGSETSFQVTELWQNDTTGTVTTLTKKIDAIIGHGWVSQETSGIEGDAQSLIVRMAWIDVDVSDKVIKQSEKTTGSLANVFGLKLAYGYARSCVSGAAALPSHVHGENAQFQPFCVCYPPKIATVWAQRRPKDGEHGRAITQGIFFAQEEEKNALQKALLGQWSLGVYTNPMFPSLLLALVIGGQIDLTTASIQNDIRGVEKRTGYHNFASRQGEKRSEGDLEELLAKTSGSASKLASTSRKSRVLERLLSFMKTTLEESETGHRAQLRGAPPKRPCQENGINEGSLGYSVFKSHVSVLQHRQEMQVTDIEYTLKRAQVQSDALFNIIQQYHADSNLELSRSTEQIAFFSYRDAASMKTLAVVTMFFLPGSFVSALFSTNCFEWASVDLRAGSIGVKTTPQMSLYWAITIPLTVLTFALYFVWLAFQKRERDNMVQDQQRERDGGHVRLDGSMKAKSCGSLEEVEDRILARRRTTMMGKRGFKFWGSSV